MKAKKIMMCVALMGMMLPVVVFAQSKPRITSPSDRSNSVFGSDINVYVSGSNIEVIYAGLTGNPNPSIGNENNFYKGTMYQSGSKFFFTPNTSTWENKWVKIIAHDKVGGGWSDPVYVKIIPKPAPGPTPQPQQSTPTQQSVNANRWINTDNAYIYSDLNLTNRKASISKGTQVYVSNKYIFNNGKQVAQIQQGYVDANNLGTATPAPTYSAQSVNAYRWINTDNVSVYSDLNLTSRKASISKGTQVYVSNKYIFNNGKQVAQIQQGYVDANSLGTTDLTQPKIENRYVRYDMNNVNYAEFADGVHRDVRGVITSTTSVNGGISAGINSLGVASATASVTIGFALSDQRGYIKGLCFKANTIVHYIYNPEWIKADGSYDCVKFYNLFVSKKYTVPNTSKQYPYAKDDCLKVLIEYNGEYYYIPRTYLGYM